MVDIERTHILRMLDANEWRIEGPQGAARALGLKPSTLRSRMRRLGVKRLPATRRPSNQPLPLA
jgi:transcriptional regulator with GAF, ATPase, and Fis domain